jgi:hypothetical protein
LAALPTSTTRRSCRGLRVLLCKRNADTRDNKKNRRCNP